MKIWAVMLVGAFTWLAAACYSEKPPQLDVKKLVEICINNNKELSAEECKYASKTLNEWVRCYVELRVELYWIKLSNGEWKHLTVTNQLDHMLKTLGLNLDGPEALRASKRGLIPHLEFNYENCRVQRVLLSSLKIERPSIPLEVHLALYRKLAVELEPIREHIDRLYAHDLPSN